MAGEVTKPYSQTELWGGGRSPFSTSYGKMMMWFFLISDALTFGGLLTALGFMKHKYMDQWPISEDVFFHFPFTHENLPLLYVALMTFILIVSSVTMVLAVEAGHRKDKAGVIKWLGLTVVGGFIFLGSQAWEWSTFINGNGDHSAAFKLKNGTIAHVVPAKGSGTDGQHASLALYADAGNPDHHEDEKHEEGGEHADATHGDDHGHHNFFDAGDDALATAVGMIQSGKADLQLPTKVYSEAEGKTVRTIVTGKEALAELKGAHHVSGANLYENEYGHNLYASFFFFITGFHGFHVFSGVVLNLIILIQVLKGIMHQRGHYEMVEKVGLYWHFVDLVWVFVFTFFYLV